MNTSATPLTGSLSVLSAPHPISSTTGGILYNVQPDELDLDIFTNRDLVEFHTELVKNNKLAALEVVLFERFINRVQPATSASPVMGTRNAQANLQAANVQPDDEDAEDLRARNKGAAQADATSRRDKKKKGDKGAKEADRVVALSVQQKAEIASKEYEEHKREMGRAQEEWEKEVDNLKVGECELCQCPEEGVCELTT